MYKEYYFSTPNVCIYMCVFICPTWLEYVYYMCIHIYIIGGEKISNALLFVIPKTKM